jgi:hypothetical protein
MKTNKLLLAAVALMGLFTSCDNKVDMLTIINKDGSMHRELSFKSDSILSRLDSSIFSGAFNDSRWVKEWKDAPKDSNEARNKKICVMKRDFSDVKELAEAYPLKINGKSILKNCDLKKSFKWFYTDYTFTETYNNYSSYFKIPLTEYLDKDAASYWTTGQPNLLEGKNGYEAQDILKNMNTQYENWLTANAANSIIEIMINDYDSIKGIPVSREQLVNHRDSLIQYIVFKGISLDKDGFGIGKLLSDYFHGKDFAPVLSENGYLAKKWGKLYSAWYMDYLGLDVNYHLAMPGTKIIDCGNGTVKDGVINYSITGVRLSSPDYKITATFRSTNYWAYVVTIALILLTILVSVKLGRKKKK